jgi:hypothetical protein
MGLGTNAGVEKIFLSIGFGKIRQKTVGKEKVTADTQFAVKRITNTGAESWALEHDYLTGRIENIFYKEDANYGNSYEVIINDNGDVYQLSFKDDNRNLFEFFKKLPNINIDKPIKITAYDFTTPDKKRVAGISISQDGVKITDAYSDRDAKGNWTLKNGYPSADGVNWKDKDEIKVYTIAVKKFFKNEFDTKFSKMFSSANTDTSVTVTESHPSTEVDEDLPF